MFNKVPFTTMLSSIVDNRGKTCPTSEIGIPLIATNCVKNSNLYPSYEKVRFVSQETYDNWFRAHPKPGDLIFVTKGSPGEVCFAPDPVDFCIAQDMVAIRADETVVYPNYLFAALRTKQAQQDILNLHVGTLIPHFKKGDFDKLLLPLPDRPTQRSIGDFYKAISIKIENNCRMNETLEEMARAIFKSWFVDFDPVHAKAAGSAPAHMDADTAVLFPSSFGDDGLPEGWKNSIIGDEVEIFGGGTPSTKEPTYWDGGEFNWCTPKDLSPLVSPVLLDTSRKITESGLKKISSGLLPEGTLLMSSRAPVGYLAISQIPVAVNQGFIAMKCTKRLSNLYALFWCQQNMDRIKNNAGGSTFAEISKTNFKPISIICPSEEVITAFDLYIGPIFSKVVSNLRENQALAELRDTLLPKLMSGEIRVKDAEREVEAAV